MPNNYEMPKELDDACDTIDAAFFSGDGFNTPASSLKMREYLARWNKQLNIIQTDHLENPQDWHDYKL